MTDHDHILRWDRPEVLKCDFCATTEGLMWIEITEKFTLAPVGELPAYEDDGGWIACQSCHEHIETGDKKYIRARAFDTLKANARNHPGQRINAGFTLAWHRRMVYAFFRHRLGSVPFG